MTLTYDEYIKQQKKKQQQKRTSTGPRTYEEFIKDKYNITSNKEYEKKLKTFVREDEAGKRRLELERQLKKQREIDEQIRNTAKKDFFYKLLNPKTNEKEDKWINTDKEGNFAQTAIATTGDVGLNLVRGVIDAGDFIGDLGSYGVAGVADLIGFDNYAKKVREGAQFRISDILNPVDNLVDPYSLSGEKLDSVFSSVGQSYAGGKVGQAFLPNAGNIPIGKLNMPVTAIATGASSSITEAYKNGANNKQALVKGITGGLIEGFSEGIFGVFGQGGSELEDMVTRTLTKKIENQVLRKIAKTGVSALGEGLEEQISYTLNWIADNGQDVVFEALGMTPENKMGKEWSWQEFGESGLSGALAGGLGAGATNIGMNKTQNQIEQAIHDTQNNLGRTLTRQEQGIVSNNVASGNQIDSKKLADAIKTDEEVVKTLVKERQKESKGKSYQEIRKEVIKDLEQGDIDINKINEIIGGKDYQTFQQYAQEIDELANRRKELKKVMNNAKEGSLEYKNAKVEYDALQEQINNYDAKTLKGNLQNLINDKVLQNGLISNSYRENAKRSVKYEADLSKYNDKEKAIVQKAIDSGVLNNTRRTHILVDMVAKLASDKGVDFDFTNNKNLEDSGFAIKGKVIDGYVTGNNIALNVESPKALNKIVGHEITHVLEGTELYDQLKTAIEKYAELKGVYKSRLEETTKRYKDVEDADVEKEVVADLVGDYIFNDPKFVQQLSTEQPSLFKKIFNEIKYLCKVVTAGSQEAKQLEKVKKIFEDVYRENSKVSEDTKFSIEYLTNQEKTPFVWLDKDLSQMDAKQQQNYATDFIQSLAGQTLGTTDGDNVVILKEFVNIKNPKKNKLTSDELYYGPTQYSNVKGIKTGELKNKILSNIDETILTSEFYKWKPDVNNRHNDLSIDAFDTRKTLVYDGKNMYEIKLDVAIMNDGTKAVYDIKRIAKKNSNLQFLPQKKNSTYKMVISQPSSLGITSSIGDNITQTPNDVKSNTAPLIKAAKKNAKLSISEDNQGRKLSKGMQNYMKDSKARVDENIDNSLVRVYHTTTDKVAQFNEFNPVGTPYYRFGDQVVNYYTNSKDMSGSYASQKYSMADTKKLGSMEDAKKWLEDNRFATNRNYDYDITTTQSGFIRVKLYDFDSGDVIAGLDFTNEAELLRNLKRDLSGILKDITQQHRIQYEGYVNITNPYIVDAEERSWRDVVHQSNDFIDELVSRVSQETKDKLTRLYRESENKSADLRQEYDDYQKIIQSINNNENISEDIKKMKHILERTGLDVIELISIGNDEGLGVSTYYTLADVLKQEDVIGGATSAYIIDEFKVPKQVKEWINKNYNEKFDVRDIKLSDNKNASYKFNGTNEISLKDLYEGNQNAYNEFDKYRMPSDYFMEQISKEGNDYLDYDLEDMFELRAELRGADVVGEEIAQAASVAFSKPELIRLWGTSKTTNDIVKEIIASNADGTTNYDGVIIKNVYDYGGKSATETTPNDLYITFNSNQFKAIDNENPTDDPDIRYSISDAGTHGTLMAMHNLSEEQFKGILELGGFPVPSIAITNPNIYQHENFGEISVLFDKETIDPSNKLNEVYASDIYSTRFPQMARSIKTETIENIVKDGYNYGINMSLPQLENLLDEWHFTIDYVPDELMQYYFAKNGIAYTEENRDLYENGEKRSEYVEWLDEISQASIGEKRIIKPDVDLFTPSGNRRTLEQRSLPYTLENIVKVMTKKRTKGSENIPYVRAGLIRGNLATKFKSIEDIKKNENRLITYEEMETLKKEVDNKFYEILDELEKYCKYYTWQTRDVIASAINETAKSKTINENVLRTKLEEEYIQNVPQETLKKVIGFLNELKYAPTEYFEAKPQRAVGLDEVQAVVIPNYVSVKFKQQLQDAGLKYYEFDPNIEGDRERVINQFDDLKFSLSNSNERTTRTPGDIYGSDIKIQQDASIIRKVQRGQALNPNEISKLTPEDANTTPILPKVDRNKVGDGDSKFAKNIKNKTKMLSEEHREMLANEEEIAYYDKVTNKESLEEAYGRLVNGSFETNKWFSKPSENATAVDVAEGWILLKQYADNNDTDGMVEVAKKLRDMGTKAGQTVQAFNIMSRLTPEGMVKYAQSELMEAYDKMVQGQTQKWINENKNSFDLQPDEVKFIMDTMKEVSMMEDGYDKRVKLAQIQKLMTDKLPPAKGAGIKSWMRISMLFNPKTQVRNVAGNAIIAPVNYFGDMFASGVDKIIGSVTGVRTTGRTKVGNYAKGFKEGLYQSYNDFKLGINTRNLEGNRFEITEGKSFNDNTKLGKALNRVDSILSFMLDAGDRGFYEAAFTNSINNQMVLNNTNEVTQEMIDIATQEALSRTWQDNNGYTKFVLNVRKGLNQINVRGYGLGDILIPFAKTPANLTKAIVDYSPVGLVTTMLDGVKLKNAIQTGQFTPQMQHKFVQELGKATAGTMLYVLGVALAKAGITSGESDEDKDVSNFLKNTLGISSYSIKIGDKTFTYDWAQPIAAPLTITSNIVNAKDNKEMALLEAIVGSMDSAGSTLLEQSFLQSINDVLNNYDGVVSGLITEVLELPSRAIPTLSKQIVDLTDNTQRQTFEKGQPVQSAINAAKAKIPGLSQKLAPQVDTLGREIQRYGGKNNAFNVFFNPANVNTENISEAAQEIYDVYTVTGDKTVMPRVVDYTYKNKDGVTIPLTTHQRAKLQKETGRVVEENVLELMDNEIYQNLSDVDKAAMLTDIVNYSYNIAKHEVLDTEVSQTYSGAYTYSKIGDISNYYLFKLPEFSADIDKDGNSISGSKKKKVVNYINSLPNLNKTEKAILVLFSGSSLKGTIYEGYDTSIVNYVKSKNLTEEEYAQVFTKLGYKYKNGRVYKK